MADIFVSYARADKARIAPLVAALERQGWSVWWDPAITPGQEFYDRITEEIDKASAVVVVWTPASVVSRWVRGEAQEAADRGILVPVRFDKARLPLDVRTLHTTDLDDWKENTRSAAFQELLGALSQLVKPRAHISPDAAPAPNETSICVLPFVNMSGDPEQEYFSDGLSEELLNQLAQLKGLNVAARTSSFAFKGQNPDLKLVSEKLGVEHVLEGSVRKQGNRLRITAQLIDAKSGYHLWSNTFNRELDDVFQIQEDIARAVADALKITLGVGETVLEYGGTKNIEAYDLYLRAQALSRHGSPQSFQRAAGLYREAVMLDPRFVQAWLGLAGAHIASSIFFPEAAEAALKQSSEALDHAKAAAPDTWMVHSMEGAQLITSKYDWLGAWRVYQKAIALVGERKLASQDYAYCQLLCTIGQMQRGIEGMRGLARTDPLSGRNRMLQYALDCAGRYEEADAEYKRNLKEQGDPALEEYFKFLRLLVTEGSQSAKVQLRRYLQLNDGYLPIHDQVLAKFEDKNAVLAVVEKAFDEPFYQTPGAMCGLAYLSGFFGDDERVVACLRRAFVDSRGLTVSSIWHPLFFSARKTEAFKDLVRDLGIYACWRESGEWGDYARPLGDDDFEIIR